MEEKHSNSSQNMSRGELIRCIVGVIILGMLLGLREEFHGLWLRILVAAFAGASLGIFVLPIVHRRRPK